MQKCSNQNGTIHLTIIPQNPFLQRRDSHIVIWHPSPSCVTMSVHNPTVFQRGSPPRGTTTALSQCCSTQTRTPLPGTSTATSCPGRRGAWSTYRGGSNGNERQVKILPLSWHLKTRSLNWLRGARLKNLNHPPSTLYTTYLNKS